MFRNALGYLFGVPLTFFVRKPAPPRELDHKEQKSEGAPLSFNERAEKAKYKGSYPAILTSMFNLELMDNPVMFNGVEKHTIDEKEFKKWEERYKKSWTAKKQEEWKKLTPENKQTENAFSKWLSEQEYIIEGPVVVTRLMLVGPNKKCIELIEEFISAIEAIASTKIDYRDLGTKKYILHANYHKQTNLSTFPFGLLNYLVELDEINSAANIHNLINFKKISLIHKLIEYAGLTNDLLAISKVLLPLHEFAAVTTKICLESHDKEDEAQAEILEVAGHKIYAINLLTRLLTLKNFNTYIKAIIFLAECEQLTQEGEQFCQESLLAFKQRLEDELTMRNKLIQSLQQLEDYHHQHLAFGFTEEKRNEFLRGINRALRAHQQSERKKKIEAFLHGLLEIPRLHRQLERTAEDVNHAIQNLRIKLDYINDAGKTDAEIKRLLNLEEVVGSRQELAAVYKEQHDQQLNRVVVCKVRLIDQIEQFLKLTDLILLTEKHSTNVLLHKELELTEKKRLYEELLLSLLPEDAKKTQRIVHLDPSILARIQHLQRRHFPHIYSFANPAILFNRFILAPSVPLIEYHPELSPQAAKK